MERKINRIYRTLSPEERAAYEQLHAKLDAERPEITAWANATMDQLDSIDRIVASLRATRVAKGISLEQVDAATGLGMANLVRLEDMDYPNPTLEMLLAYAAVIGVELQITLVDKTKGKLIESPAA